MEVLTSQQLRGVGRRRSCQQQVEVIIDARRTDGGAKVCIGNLILDQQLTDTHRAVLQIEQATQGGLTDIQTAEDDLLAQQRKGHSEVRCQERLTLTRGTGSKEDDLVVLLHHELDIGTHGAEDLVNLVVLVRLYDDTGSGLHVVTGYRHICHDGKTRQTQQVIMTFDAEAQQLNDQEDGKRNAQAQHDGYQQDDGTLGAHLSHRLGLVNKLTLIRRGCQGDTVLLALLQQEQIQTGLDLLLTANLRQDTLLLRRAANAALVFRILALNALTLNVRRTACLQQGGTNGRLQVAQGGCQGTHLRSLLRG